MNVVGGIMKFVIYGAGYRGKRLIHFLGKENVVVFIDGDLKKVGTTYLEKPVITISEYKIKYSNFFIIISPVNTNEITKLLRENGIFQYNILPELPSEFNGYGNCSLVDICSALVRKLHNIIYLYGINAYSLMLYDAFRESFDVHLVKSDKDRELISEWVKNNYTDIVIEDVSDIAEGHVLLTIRMEEKEKEKLFLKNQVLDAFYFSCNMEYYYNSQVQKFRLEHGSGERCFIVANGPSLKIEDLELLKDEFCFGMNKIFMATNSWKPNVYVCSDSFLINDMTDKIADYDCKCKFIGDSGEKYWEKAQQNSYKIHVVAADSYGILPPFSEDICQKIYGYYTVTYVCMQIACFMGFREIYLLGVDCNYIRGSAENYFYKNEKVDNLDHNEYGMIMAFKAAKKYADEHGIKIYNATRGGMLEVFERVDLDSVLNLETDIK
ncbi:DUF115 domain-containing protein [Parablautia intestinalis]|uniref:DUF115 domain-containing protein n=2 Tax=Parablautia intestinalis TaxID=2320100 RepID=A0A3A9A768_9FIRM|nr:DUF115 domain-containing protein [Parablautia intestinalis]